MAGPSPFPLLVNLCCSIPEHSCVCTLSSTVDGSMLCVVCKPPMQRRRNHSHYQLAYIMFNAVLHVPALVVNQSMDNGVHFIHMPIFFSLETPTTLILLAFPLQHLPCLFSFKCEGRILYPAALFLVWARWSCLWFILAPMANRAPAHVFNQAQARNGCVHTSQINWTFGPNVPGPLV